MDNIDGAPLLDTSQGADESNLNSYLDDKLFNFPVPGDSSMFGTIQILLNTAIGSGTLMVPYCYKLGIGFAISLSLIIGLISLGTFWMMIDAAYKTKCYDYRGLFTYCYTDKHIWIIDLIIFLVQVGSCMIYCLWNGVLLNRTIGIKGKVLGSDVFWIMLVTFGLAFPMTCFKSIAKLEPIATFGSGFILMLIAHAAYWMIKDTRQYGFDPHHEIRFFKYDGNILITALGINAMSYNCIINLFPTLEHLKVCTVRRGRKLAGLTALSCFFLYGAFGMFTYLDKFNSLKPSSALELYNPKHPFTIIATLGVVIILLVSSPLVIWAARNSVNAFFWKDTPMTNLRWYTLGFVLCGISGFFACSSSNIVIFFNIVGGLLIPVVAILAPTLFFLTAVKERPWYRTIQAFITIAFALVAAVCATWQTIQEIKK